MKMRRLFLVSLSSLLVLCPCVRAQGVPSAWKGYQSDNYVSNIQESYNEKNEGAADLPVILRISPLRMWRVR